MLIFIRERVFWGAFTMKLKKLNILTIIFTFSIFSIALSSPLDDYTETENNVKGNNMNNMALYTPVNKKPKLIDDNTLFVIHIDVGNKESVESSYPYENNTIVKGFERGLNSYVNIFDNIRNKNSRGFFRRH